MKKKILIVDDESSARFLLNLMLRDKFEVATAGDCSSAVNRASEVVFDLVLMDINLGNSESGVTALKQLRELKEYTNVPIIAVTAFAMPKDKKDLLNEGFNEYLAKPFDRDELIQLIDKTLINHSSLKPDQEDP